MELPERLPAPRCFTRSIRFFVLLSVLLATGQGASAAWLDDQIVWIKDRLNQTYSRANSAYVRANAAAIEALKAAQNTDGLQDLLGRVQTAYQSLDGPIVDVINDLILMMIKLFEQQQEGYEAFTTPNGEGTTPADTFRTELMTTLDEITLFSKELIALNPDSPIGAAFSFDFEVIELFPDRLLFPLQKMLKEKAGFSPRGILDQIEALKEDLPLVAEAYAASEMGDDAYAASGSGGPRPLSTWSFAQRSAIEKTGKGWKIAGHSFTVVANAAKIFGEAGGTVEGKVGIHGYIAIHEDWNIPGAVGGVIEILADLMLWNGERLEGLFSDAETTARQAAILEAIESNRVAFLTNQATILANQERILDGQERLFAAMKRIDPALFPEVGQTPPSATVAMDVPPSRLHVDFGEPVTFTAGAVESPNAAYQWRKDGIPIQGAVYSSFIIRDAGPDDAGDYDVIITDESGSQVSAASTLDLIPGRVMNVSVRQIIPDNGVLITGFVLDSEKQVVVRGVGRSLEAFGIPADQTMQDPLIEVYDSSGEIVASNDNYQRSAEAEAAMQAVGAFPITADNDAAIITKLPVGAYTVHMKGADLKGGDCIVEVYDTDDN